MRLIIEEVYRSLSSNKGNTRLFILQLTISIILLTVMINQIFLTSTGVRDNIEKYESVNYFTFVDNYFNEEAEFRSEIDNLTNLKTFYNTLTDNQDVLYLDVVFQNLEVEYFTGEAKFYAGYEIGHDKPATEFLNANNDLVPVSRIKSVQLSMNSIEYFSLETNAGRMFESEDFIGVKDTFVSSNGQLISQSKYPVILGDDYTDNYSIGECFNANHLGNFVTIEVIGFLEPDSKVFDGHDFIYLDRYMILPSILQEFEVSSYEEKNFYVINYMSKLCGGMLVSDDTIDDVHTYLLRKSKLSDLKPYKIIGYDSSLTDVFNLDSKKLTQLITIFFITVIIFTTFGLSLNMITRINSNVSYYAPHILSGADLRIFKKYIIYEIGFIFLMSYIISMPILWLNFDLMKISYLIALLFTIGIYVFILILPLREINRMDMSVLIKGGA